MPNFSYGPTKAKRSLAGTNRTQKGVSGTMARPQSGNFTPAQSQGRTMAQSQGRTMAQSQGRTMARPQSGNFTPAQSQGRTWQGGNRYPKQYGWSHGYGEPQAQSPVQPQSQQPPDWYTQWRDQQQQRLETQPRPDWMKQWAEQLQQVETPNWYTSPWRYQQLGGPTYPYGVSARVPVSMYPYGNTYGLL